MNIAHYCPVEIQAVFVPTADLVGSHSLRYSSSRTIRHGGWVTHPSRPSDCEAVANGANEQHPSRPSDCEAVANGANEKLPRTPRPGPTSSSSRGVKRRRDPVFS